MVMLSPQAYVGPLVALFAVGGLAQVLRWTYGSSRGAPPVLADEDNYGLLREVAVVADTAEAEGLRALLTDERIRSTCARGPQGRTLVLVFAADLDRARQLVGPR
jgi:hypothetical protein